MAPVARGHGVRCERARQQHFAVPLGRCRAATHCHVLAAAAAPVVQGAGSQSILQTSPATHSVPQCAAAAIVASLDGRHVFVSVRGLESGPNCISRFAFLKGDGGSSLQFLGTRSSLGCCPRAMVRHPQLVSGIYRMGARVLLPTIVQAMHPALDVLYCANQDSDSIIAFKVPLRRPQRLAFESQRSMTMALGCSLQSPLTRSLRSQVTAIWNL